MSPALESAGTFSRPRAGGICAEPACCSSAWRMQTKPLLRPRGPCSAARLIIRRPKTWLWGARRTWLREELRELARDGLTLSGSHGRDL